MITDWMKFGSCVGSPDPERYFDKYLKNPTVALQVQKMCVDCPVRTECFNYGVTSKSTGVWGGLWLQTGKVIKKLDSILSSYYWED